MTQDITAAIITHLAADAAVSAIVGSAVYGGELPASVAASMPIPAVVVVPSGGISKAARSFQRHDTQRVDVKSYQTTVTLAAALDRAVTDALRTIARTVIGTTLVHWVEPAGGHIQRRDPDLDWPFALTTFSAYYALEAAT